MAIVRCRPDIVVDDLKKRVKDEFKRKLDKWDSCDLTLTFNGTKLNPHELIADVISDMEGGKEPVPVIVSTP